MRPSLTNPFGANLSSTVVNLLAIAGPVHPAMRFSHYPCSHSEHSERTASHDRFPFSRRGSSDPRRHLVSSSTRHH